MGNSSGESPSNIFTSRTPILGLKLYAVIIVTVVISVAVFVLIFLFLRTLRKSNRRRVSLRQSPGLLPLVSNEITGAKRKDQSQISKVEEFEKKEKECAPILSKDVRKFVEIESEVKKASSESNESSTSRSESSSALSASTSSDGMNIGWGRWYSLKEIQVATNWFSDENVVGEGGYGIVYRGVMVDGSVVAVKNLLNNK